MDKRAVHCRTTPISPIPHPLKLYNLVSSNLSGIIMIFICWKHKLNNRDMKTNPFIVKSGLTQSFTFHSFLFARTFEVRNVFINFPNEKSMQLSFGLCFLITNCMLYIKLSLALSLSPVWHSIDLLIFWAHFKSHKDDLNRSSFLKYFFYRFLQKISSIRYW